MWRSLLCINCVKIKSAIDLGFHLYHVLTEKKTHNSGVTSQKRSRSSLKGKRTERVCSGTWSAEVILPERCSAG